MCGCSPGKVRDETNEVLDSFDRPQRARRPDRDLSLPYVETTAIRVAIRLPVAERVRIQSERNQVLPRVIDDAPDRFGAIEPLLVCGPQQRIGSPPAAECPLGEPALQAESDVAHHGRSHQGGDQRAERVDVVLVAVDDGSSLAAGPSGQTPGLPKSRNRPAEVEPWHRALDEGHVVPAQPVSQLSRTLHGHARTRYRAHGRG